MKKILISVLLFCLPIIAEAAGVTVTPSSLVYFLPTESRLAKKITITNSFGSPQIYEIYSDELAAMLQASPANFRLEPGEKQTVQITASGPKSGNFAGYLSVLASDMNRRQFNASTGVKIPVQITVLTAAPSFFQKNFIWFIMLLCVLILALDLLIIYNKKMTFRQKLNNLIESIITKIKR